MTIILAAGDYPKKKSKAHKLLESATRVVACDGAASAYIKDFGKFPEIIIGDLDSIDLAKLSASDNLPGEEVSNVVRISDQDTNDLAKAIDFCRARGWCDIIVVGATGKREDHTIANVFLALEKEVMIVSDYGIFAPVKDSLELTLRVGTPVSVFATDPRTKVESVGLEWPLNTHKFTNLYSAALNRTNAEKISLTTNRPILVYTAI